MYKPHNDVAIGFSIDTETDEIKVEKQPMDDNICGPHCHNLTNGRAQKGDPDAFRAGWERTFGTKQPRQVS